MEELYDAESIYKCNNDLYYAYAEKQQHFQYLKIYFNSLFPHFVCYF
jgi:hypothetical protein